MSYTDYIWDLGGTLLDNYQTSATAFHDVLLESFGVNVGYHAVYDALRVSTDFAVSQFAAGLPDFVAMYKKREAQTLTTPVLFPDAIRVLATIVESGHRNFMISHRNDQVLEILAAAGISSYFTEVVTSSNGFARKPSPDSINYLLDTYKPGQPVMIGDRDIDILAGQHAHIDTIFFASEDQEMIKATHHVTKLIDILEL
ncbi:HAD-IA family hydrolase [Pseudolactococcus chungangensis]|uniref:HAD-IA family hydrolase n=1 Tax=Pseudolactococcus chungangensis TaxID=451457 RepID=UPI0028D0268A|nr:HAD-IA family hydrolase [Lactococcus chungangensis]